MTTQSTTGLVDKMLWQVEQCCGPLSREVCVCEGDDDYSILRHNFTALLSTQDTTIAELVAALEQIADEAERENGGWVHLKRVIGLHAQTALTKSRSAL